MTTGKNIALTRRTFVGKVMSLLLNMLSRLVITFLSIQSAKTRLGADCGSDHELLIAKFTLKLKKVGKNH